MKIILSVILGHDFLSHHGCPCQYCTDGQYVPRGSLPLLSAGMFHVEHWYISGIGTMVLTVIFGHLKTYTMYTRCAPFWCICVVYCSTFLSGHRCWYVSARLVGGLNNFRNTNENDSDSRVYGTVPYRGPGGGGEGLPAFNPSKISWRNFPY